MTSQQNLPAFVVLTPSAARGRSGPVQYEGDEAACVLAPGRPPTGELPRQERYNELSIGAIGPLRRYPPVRETRA